MMKAIATAVLAVVMLAPAAMAAPSTPDLAGQWKTDSLTQNRIGYELTLRAAGTNAYNGTLQFRHRDGRKTKPTTVGLAVGRTKGDRVRVTIVMPGGSLANNSRTVSGWLSKTDGSMYFAKCSSMWPLAMKGEEDTDCLFREMPS
jgi:hypothetical protein